jgi:hypothetical protein
MQIGTWSAGKTPDELEENWTMERWIAEGKAIPGVERILQELIQHPVEEMHPILAVQALGFVGTAESIPVLVEQLDDEWSVMQNEAVWALGEIGGPEVVQPLIKAMPHLDSPKRLEVARALVKTGDSKAFLFLEEHLEAVRELEVDLTKEVAELRHELEQAGWEPPKPPEAERYIIEVPKSGADGERHWAGFVISSAEGVSRMEAWIKRYSLYEDILHAIWSSRSLTADSPVMGNSGTVIHRIPLKGTGTAGSTSRPSDSMPRDNGAGPAGMRGQKSPSERTMRWYLLEIAEEPYESLQDILKTYGKEVDWQDEPVDEPGMYCSHPEVDHDAAPCPNIEDTR